MPDLTGRAVSTSGGGHVDTMTGGAAVRVPLLNKDDRGSAGGDGAGGSHVRVAAEPNVGALWMDVQCMTQSCLAAGTATQTAWKS